MWAMRDSYLSVMYINCIPIYIATNSFANQ